MNWDDYSIIMPGRITEFFPTDQTASIQISSNHVSSSASSLDEVGTNAVLLDVPVHTASGGGFAITFPIKVGDTCLILFSQFGYDHWFNLDNDTEGELFGRPAPWTSRRFSIRDGLALVGFNTLPRAIASFDADDSQWRNDDATQRISLNADESITIDSDVSLTINAPAVTVNCTTAVIDAVTSVTLDAPLTSVTGNLLVAGAIGGGGASVPGSGMDITGAITASGDVSSGSHTLDTHIHAGDGGSGSGADTGAPI